MRTLWKGFSVYAVVGIANMLIHWQLFFLLTVAFNLSQELSNFLAFCAASTFSFYMNALFTFAMPASLPRYFLFMAFMGGLSLAIGWLADHWVLPGIVTLVVFTLISLVSGFLFSRWVVFRIRES